MTILEKLEANSAPCLSRGGGVRLFVPRKSVRDAIGPITVEETAELVNGDDDSMLVVMQAVHCLPTRATFEVPLMLEFIVRDGRVWWWDRAAVREEVLREYQVRSLWTILGMVSFFTGLHFGTNFSLHLFPRRFRSQVLSKQRKDDPWQKMDPDDVSVVWDDQSSVCLRARIKHFTWFGSARRTPNASANLVSRHWDKSVLVVNATNSVAHVTPLPISFNTSKEATKSCSLTFCEAGVSFETGKKTEQVMLPVNRSSEILPAGGMTELFLSGGAKEMQVIVCFLPGRNKSTQSTSSSSAASPEPRVDSSTSFRTTATSTQQATPPMDPSTSTGAAPSSGASPPLGEHSLAWTTSPATAAVARQSNDGQDTLSDSEEMIYCMTKVLPGWRRLTLLRESVNRKIKIEKNARALETYAMMLADFGTAPP